MALVAVDESRETGGGLLLRVDVPIALPEGLSFAGHFGRPEDLTGFAALGPTVAAEDDGLRVFAVTPGSLTVCSPSMGYFGLGPSSRADGERCAMRTIGVFLLALLLPAAGAAGGRTLVVNSLDDLADPPAGTVTLRSALDAAPPGGRIRFDPALSGGTISLTLIATDHTVLRGEVFPQGKFAGYEERDYGRSALYAAKDVAIDAGDLPGGIAVRYDGAAPARVLAVYGDLRMTGVAITGGRVEAEAIAGGTQPWTLARGGGLAVWGTARLTRCRVFGNRARGDLEGSRDRGSFGGGLYAERVELTDCVISGNRAEGYGAAGGGVYSVGGVEHPTRGSFLTRCAITGNRVTAQHAYGGGVYSDGGGPGNRKTITLVNCTLARNLVEDNPVLTEPPGSQYYYRGGGFYMSNGSLVALSCTVAENAVTGHPAVFSNRPNMGGGALAATIGNAHVVEQMLIANTIAAGNTVNGEAGDVFSGSLLRFLSGGGNLVGRLTLAYLLVPVPRWGSLCRSHWPEEGDEDGVAAGDVLDLAGAATDPEIVSAGAAEGAAAVLWYPPAGVAVDRVTKRARACQWTAADYSLADPWTGRLLNLVLEVLREDYAGALGADFGASFGDMSGTTFFTESDTWPSRTENAAWIAFFRAVEAEIAGRLGPAPLSEEFWEAVKRRAVAQGDPFISLRQQYRVRLPATDQRRGRRPAGEAGDAGAVEAGAAVR